MSRARLFLTSRSKLVFLCDVRRASSSNALDSPMVVEPNRGPIVREVCHPDGSVGFLSLLPVFILCTCYSTSPQWLLLIFLVGETVLRWFEGHKIRQRFTERNLPWRHVIRCESLQWRYQKNASWRNCGMSPRWIFWDALTTRMVFPGVLLRLGGHGSNNVPGRNWRSCLQRVSSNLRLGVRSV